MLFVDDYYTFQHRFSVMSGPETALTTSGVHARSFLLADISGVHARNGSIYDTQTVAGK